MNVCRYEHSIHVDFHVLNMKCVPRSTTNWTVHSSQQAAWVRGSSWQRHQYSRWSQRVTAALEPGGRRFYRAVWPSDGKLAGSRIWNRNTRPLSSICCFSGLHLSKVTLWYQALSFGISICKSFPCPLRITAYPGSLPALSRESWS